MKRNGGDESQIRELRKKANIVMRKIWGIGERKFKDDFRRKMWLFRHLVLGVAMHGAEVWDWREREELEGIQKKFIKWSLRLDSCTSDYILYKETNTGKLRELAGCRALGFEERTIRREKDSDKMYKRKGKRRKH